MNGACRQSRVGTPKTTKLAVEGINRRRQPSLGELAEDHRGQSHDPDDRQHSYDHQAHAPRTAVTLRETLIKRLNRLVDIGSGRGAGPAPRARAATGLLPEAEVLHDHRAV